MDCHDPSLDCSTVYPAVPGEKLDINNHTAPARYKRVGVTPLGITGFLEKPEENEFIMSKAI